MIAAVKRSTLVLVLAVTCSPLAAEQRIIRQLPAAANGAAAAGMVPLPHVMRDNFGVTWDVQQDGSIGDGGNDLYDGAARLVINDNGFNPQPSATFDPATNEVTFAAQVIGELRVSRRIAVNAAAGWCRYTEVFENPGAAPARARIHLSFDMGGGIQQAQQVEDPKKKTPLGAVIFDGRRAVAMLGAGVGGKVVCRYQPQQNSDQCDLNYEVEVPPKQTAAVVHFQAMRPTMQQASDFMLQAKEKDLLATLPKEIRKAVVNFRRGGDTLEEIELPRNGNLDTIELRSGDQYRGTLTDAIFRIDSFDRTIDLPAAQVLGMLTVGAYRPSQLFVTIDGQIIGGTLKGDAMKLQLSSGQTIAVPLMSIAKVGCRKRPGEPEEFKFDKPMAFLRDGQRLIVDAPSGVTSVSTLYGDLKLQPQTVASVRFHGEEQVVHQLKLRDGSKFVGLVMGESMELRLRGIGDASSPPVVVKVPLTSIDRLQIVPGEAEPPQENPTLTFGNGDLLVGSVAGTLELETGFDLLKLNGAEVRAIRHVEAREGDRALPWEVTITLWDNQTLSGRLRGDAVDFVLPTGDKLKVPVSVIDVYEHPNPAAPSEMVDEIRRIVKQLADPDWKKREQAARQLRGIGEPASSVLREMHNGQSPEAQKHIDTLLKQFEADRAGAKKSPAPPPASFNKDDLLDQ